MAKKVSRFRFTKTALEELTAPASGRVEHHDTGQPGLTLRITSNDTRTFYLYRRVQGRPERIKIGRFPGIAVEIARGEAVKHLGEIAKGNNPADDRRNRRRPKTFGALFEQYMELHSKPNKKTWAADEWRWKKHVADLAGTPLWRLRKVDIVARVVKVEQESGHAEANNVLILIRSILGKAVEWGYLTDTPARGIRRYRITPRERYLSADEVKRLFTALGAETDRTLADYVVLSLLTGQRSGNMLRMMWEDLDLDLGLWTIAAGEMKGKRSHRVPIVPRALEVLRQRRAMLGEDEVYVFPSDRSETAHRGKFNRAFGKLLKRAGITNVRIHDLRRTLASWQAAAGVSLALIQQTLAHADVGTTMIYARLNVDPVRRAMEEAATAILDAAAEPDQQLLPPGTEGTVQ